jgi:hypothetical protein
MIERYWNKDEINKKIGIALIPKKYVHISSLLSSFVNKLNFIDSKRTNVSLFSTFGCFHCLATECVTKTLNLLTMCIQQSEIKQSMPAIWCMVRVLQ